MMLDGLLICGKCGEQMLGKEITDINTRSYYTCKKHNYLRQSPDLLEGAILEESAKFITQQFQTNFLEVYNLVHGDLIKFYEKSIRESVKALERQYQLMHTLHESVDLVKAVLQYDAEKRKSLIQNVIHRVVLDAPTLKIQFREPFNGVLGHANII